MKTKKNYFFSSFWALFVNYSENKNFSRKSASITFFYFLVSIAVKNFRIKLLKRSKRKLATELQTYLQTNEWIPRQA